MTRKHEKDNILKTLTTKKATLRGTFFMNAKNNKRSARMSSKKVTISNQANGLTRQAGLVPVVKFLSNVGMIGLVKSDRRS